MIHHSYCEFHLGDNIVHLQFLRKLAKANPSHFFIHAIHRCYFDQLFDCTIDVENLSLSPVDNISKDELSSWRNVWKNADGFWEKHTRRSDFVGFYIDWFYVLAEEMKLKSPILEPSDFLFDYPALTTAGIPPDLKFDVLLINSAPCSGQLKPYNGPEYFAPMVDAIEAMGKTVAVTDPIPGRNNYCTRSDNLTITQIGRLSTRCSFIVAVATGPLWPCLNKANTEKPIIVMFDHVLGHEDLTGITPNISQVRSKEEAWLKLIEKGLL